MNSPLIHLIELLNPVESVEQDIADTVNLDEDNGNCLNYCLSPQEVTEATKVMKRNKSFGVDMPHVPAEVLKKQLSDRVASSPVL